jgi:hypothetical protein
MRLIIDDMEKNIAKVATCVVGGLSSNLPFVQKLNKLRNRAGALMFVVDKILSYFAPKELLPEEVDDLLESMYLVSGIADSTRRSASRQAVDLALSLAAAHYLNVV